VGLDVPVETKFHPPNLRPEWVYRPGLIASLARTDALLAGTLSLREIGQEMRVSANTIKTHTQAIYRKLGVSGRFDAVEAARLLGL
jgi:ATP/maltotriose-dependent transcriptional regulator MalT